MQIEKNGKTYAVKENKLSWTLESPIGKVVVSYNVEKTVCKTFDDLKEFVYKNKSL